MRPPRPALAPCLRRALRDRRGAAVVELALAIPLLLLLMVGMVEMGRAIDRYLTVLQATEQAALLTLDPLVTDAQVAQRLRGWASPLTLGSVTVNRQLDRTEVRATYAIPIQIKLLRTALKKDTIHMATRSVAPARQ